jgi:hypothetical protein
LIVFLRIYVGAPRALLARHRSPNNTETLPNDRLFGNIFECLKGTNECRPLLFESKIIIFIFLSLIQIWFYLIDELAESMPSFNNVLDDAWLGASLIATSDDSLVVRNKNILKN